jgi:hypothetical protein
VAAAAVVLVALALLEVMTEVVGAGARLGMRPPGADMPMFLEFLADLGSRAGNFRFGPMSCRVFALDRAIYRDLSSI